LQDVAKELDEKKNKKKRGQKIFMTRCQTALATTDLDRNAIALDTEASVSVFANPNLLTNIRRLPEPIPILGVNNQTIYIEHEGDTRRFGVVLYSAKVPCNILSYYEVSRRHSLSYTQSEQLFRVSFKDGVHMDFHGNDKTRVYLHKLHPSLHIDDDAD
jgi:hypothetical protein